MAFVSLSTSWGTSTDAKASESSYLEKGVKPLFLSKVSLNKPPKSIVTSCYRSPICDQINFFQKNLWSGGIERSDKSLHTVKNDRLLFHKSITSLVATRWLMAQYKTYGKRSRARTLMICKWDANDIHERKWLPCTKLYSHALVYLRRDSHQVMPSLVGKNILCVYGRSTITAHRMEKIFAVFLSFLLCSLCCVNLLHMKFRCHIAILALENHRNSVYLHRCLYILASQGRRDLVWITPSW